MLGMCKITNWWMAGFVVAFAFFAGTPIAQASGFRVLYNFTGGNDGNQPTGTLIKDKAGNLYGTTCSGGSNGGGVVYRLAPDGTETVLHSFSSFACPHSGVIKDGEGNLYGTTLLGGAYHGGTVFKLTPGGEETELYTFTTQMDPDGRLVRDNAGNLYGTTGQGGGGGPPKGCGTVYELESDGKLTVLHTFAGASDGCGPRTGVMRDAFGNFYGTTSRGGAYNAGTVFRLVPDGTETILHSFGEGGDGKAPYAGLAMDDAGNLYGTTFKHGADKFGTVFTVTPDGRETVLYSFGSAGSDDGRNPNGSVIMDSTGTLFGTTSRGGAGPCRNGCGTIFKLGPGGKETLLHSFNFDDGAGPNGNLLRSKGKLYGVTAGGGSYEEGTVFEIDE